MHCVAEHASPLNVQILQQLDGTSAWQSAEGYPFQVWSLLELVRAGIATPLDRDYTGTCAKVFASLASAEVVNSVAPFCYPVVPGPLFLVYCIYSASFEDV